jgi:hypothetical protein
MQGLLLALGMLIIGLTLNDVFQSVIVPRASAVSRFLRPTYYLVRGTWQLWPTVALTLHPSDSERREDILATFAPLILVTMIILWASLLTFGWGMLLWALRSGVHPILPSFGDAVYLAGTSFFTIGFGDYVGSSGWTHAVTVLAGASGLLVVSVTTAFLFAIFGAFQAREQFVVTVGVRAGSPPSGVGLLVIAGHKHLNESLGQLMHDAQRWCASLMETHLAYPILGYFRSSHDYESWVGTLGTLLDAATLMITTVECDAGEAYLLHDIGRHAARDLAVYFNLDGETSNPGIAQEEFDRACARLVEAGYQLREKTNAWKRFATMRVVYAGDLAALARFFSIPPLEWVGDRSLISAPQQHIGNGVRA